MEFKAGNFAVVLGKDLEEHGILEDSYLYLAGDTFIPETKDDPYLYRKAFIAARVVEMHIQAEEKPFLITAKNLAPIEERELEILQAIYEEDFGGEDGRA